MKAERFFRPRNWNKFQHYKDRNPTWIKLHQQLLRDYKFAALTELQQCHLMKLWMLYAEVGRALQWDCKWVARQLGADSRAISRSLDALLSSGFIELASEDASEEIAPCSGSASLETETETEKETTTGEPPDGDFAFAGAVIRLNQDDFDGWVRAFPNLSLRAELVALDAWYAENLRGSARKQWFSRCASALAKKNSERKATTERYGVDQWGFSKEHAI